MSGQRKYTFFAFLTVSVCILAIYIHRHREGKTGRIDDLLISTSGSIQNYLFYFTHGSRTLVDNYFLLVNTRKRNQELEEEVGRLRDRIAQLQDVEIENGRLRQGLEFQQQTQQKLVSAHIIAHDASSEYFGLRIDKGTEDGVRQGMGVVSHHGVVGRVHRVTKHFADVLTLIDPTSNIDGIIQRSRARGVVTGQNKQLTCRMKYIDRLDDVQLGDKVVSTGFGGIYPKGLLVGEVTAVIPSSSGILQTVTVKAAVDIYRLEEVFVVFPSGESETPT